MYKLRCSLTNTFTLLFKEVCIHITSKCMRRNASYSQFHVINIIIVLTIILFLYLSDTRSYETLNPLLKEIEIVCFKIGKTMELGAKW